MTFSTKGTGNMTLYDLLTLVTYNQILNIYLTNDNDHNDQTLLGCGTRLELMSDDEETVFKHLADKIEMITVANDKSLVINIATANRATPPDDLHQLEYEKRWKSREHETRSSESDYEIGGF